MIVSVQPVWPVEVISDVDIRPLIAVVIPPDDTHSHVIVLIRHLHRLKMTILVSKQDVRLPRRYLHELSVWALYKIGVLEIRILHFRSATPARPDFVRGEEVVLDVTEA